MISWMTSMLMSREASDTGGSGKQADFDLRLTLD
jgi:hypothetical protein